MGFRVNCRAEPPVKPAHDKQTHKLIKLTIEEIETFAAFSLEHNRAKTIIHKNYCLKFDLWSNLGFLFSQGIFGVLNALVIVLLPYLNKDTGNYVHIITGKATVN